MHERRVLNVRLRRVAAPARQDDGEPRVGLPPHVDAICQEWARWVQTRKFYAPNPNLKSILGVVRTSRATAPTAPAVFASRDLAVFHQAVLCQHDERARAIFEAHYLLRVKPIKAAAAKVGMSRSNWYYVTNTFAKRAYGAYQRLLEAPVESG